MKNQTNSNQNCGCGEGTICCTPPKKSLWKIVLFVAIILAAGAIITLKLVGDKEDIQTENCCPKTENTTCCPESEATNCCPQSENKTCCPKSE